MDAVSDTAEVDALALRAGELTLLKIGPGRSDRVEDDAPGESHKVGRPANMRDARPN